MAKTLNFTDTARRMHLTQQAVSKNIANLENDLGFPLFLRTAKGASLTPEGAELRDLFTRYWDECTDKITELRGRNGGVGSSLRVGYQNHIELSEGILKANKAFSDLYADTKLICIRHSPGDLYCGLADGDLDLVTMTERHFLGGPEFERLQLLTVPAVIMVSQDNPLVTEYATTADFSNEPFIVEWLRNENTVDFNRRILDEINANGLQPSNIITVPNRDSAYSAAELGEGIILGSELSQTAKYSRLIHYRTGALETISCFWRKGLSAPAPIYASLLKEALEKQDK